MGPWALLRAPAAAIQDTGGFANVPKSLERNLRSEHLISKGRRKSPAFPEQAPFVEIAADHRMTVQITLNKTNSSRIQLARVRSTKERGGIGPGFALPPFNPNALREIEDVLRGLGVNEGLTTEKTALLRQVGPNDLVKKKR
jgi:hypothetical protein